jgi:hypothetical protein
VVPDVGIRALTEENPRLNPDTPLTDTSSSTSAILAAAATIATFNERGFLSFEPALVSYRYSDVSNADLESDDVYFGGRGEYRWQTVTAGFNGTFSRERLLSAELVDVDPDNDPDTDDPDTGDSGRLVFIDQERDRHWVNPYVSFRVSERNRLRLDATRYGTSYSGGNLSFRTGFENTRVSAGLYRNVDERNLVSAVMAVETYEADANQNTTDTVTDGSLVVEFGCRRATQRFRVPHQHPTIDGQRHHRLHDAPSLQETRGALEAEHRFHPQRVSERQRFLLRAS